MPSCLVEKEHLAKLYINQITLDEFS